MSELIRWQDKDLTEYYNADEVDAVLANKDREIAELKKSISRLLKADMDRVMDKVVQQTLIYGDGLVPVEHAMKLVVEVQHQKYKRCHDNAWRCRKLSNVYALIAYTHRGWKIAGYYDDKAELYRKWNTRWLDLAEKFKEATDGSY